MRNFAREMEPQTLPHPCSTHPPNRAQPKFLSKGAGVAAGAGGTAGFSGGSTKSLGGGINAVGGKGSSSRAPNSAYAPEPTNSSAWGNLPPVPGMAEYSGGGASRGGGVGRSAGGQPQQRPPPRMSWEDQPVGGGKQTLGKSGLNRYQ